jgi:hypothetical protein
LNGAAQEVGQSEGATSLLKTTGITDEPPHKKPSYNPLVPPQDMLKDADVVYQHRMKEIAHMITQKKRQTENTLNSKTPFWKRKQPKTAPLSRRQACLGPSVQTCVSSVTKRIACSPPRVQIVPRTFAMTVASKMGRTGTSVSCAKTLQDDLQIPLDHSQERTSAHTNKDCDEKLCLR